jgi:hypothetical protein
VTSHPQPLGKAAVTGRIRCAGAVAGKVDDRHVGPADKAKSPFAQ